MPGCSSNAPDLAEEATSIQAKVAVEQAWEKARAQDQVGALDLKAERSGNGAQAATPAPAAARPPPA